jgi:hypothetical protein
MNLQEWLHVATQGLKPVQKERIALEIKSHLEDAQEHLVTAGVSPEVAQQKSLDGLGDPLVASRAFLATYSRPFALQSLATLLYLFLSFPLGIVYFVILLTGFAVGIALAWTWVGIPILAATFGLVLGFAVLERSLAAGLLGVYVARRPVYNVQGKGFWARAKAHLSDKGTWQDVLYLFLKFPLGVLAFVLALVLVVVPLAFIAVPFVVAFVPDSSFGYTYFLPWVDRFAASLEATNGWLALLIGALLLPVSLYLLNLLAAWYGGITQHLLGNGARSVALQIQSPQMSRTAGVLFGVASGLVFAVSSPVSPFPVPAQIIAGEVPVLEKKTLELDDVKLLEVSTDRATVRVRGGQSRSYVQIRRWGSQSYGLQRSENRLILKENRLPNCQGCKAEIEVYLATEVPLLIRNNLGEITVEGLKAAVEIRNDEGNVTLKQLSGPVIAQTNRGDIRLNQASQTARLATDDGNIWVSNLEGDLNSRANNGNLNTQQTGGSLDLQTDHGTITVREARGQILAKNNSGDITLQTVWLEAGSSNRLQTDAGSLSVTALDAPAGLTLMGRKDSGSLQVNLEGVTTQVFETRFESKRAGENPARLELITNAGDITVQ